MIDSAKKYKGIAELEICGDKVGFKFGMATTKYCCELEGLKCDAEGTKELGVRLASLNPETYMNFFYAAHVCYTRLFKTTEYSFDEVCNYVDNMNPEVTQQVIQDAFAQPPNSAAP